MCWDTGIWDMKTVGFSWKLKNLRFCFTFSDIRQALRRPRRFQDGWNLVLLSSHGAHLLAPLQFTSTVSSHDTGDRRQDQSRGGWKGKSPGEGGGQ